jgi:hypothetical protein
LAEFEAWARGSGRAFSDEDAREQLDATTLHLLHGNIATVAALAVDAAACGDVRPAGLERRVRERLAQAALIRDILGNNLLAKPAMKSEWLRWNDGCVRRLAQTIYDEGRFDDLPVLADALEEAGCASPAILQHCRSGGEHVRGCWVVDRLLNRK